MLFSVIVPVYNSKPYLKDCFDSILRQTFEDYEVIVVENGSTDGGDAFCDDYKDTPRFRILHEENNGLSGARNTGIREAKGEYLLFLDSDDILLHKDDLEKLATAIQKSSPDLLYARSEEYNEDYSKMVLSHSLSPYAERTVYRAKEELANLYRAGDLWVTFAQTKIVSRKFLLENNLFFKNGIFHEDDEWTARLLFANPAFTVCDTAFYGYRHRANSITTTADEKKLCKRVCDRLELAASVSHMTENRAVLGYFALYFFTSLLKAKELSDKAKETVEAVAVKNRSVLANLRFAGSKYHIFIYCKSLLVGKKKIIRDLIR